MQRVGLHGATHEQRNIGVDIIDDVADVERSALIENQSESSVVFGMLTDDHHTSLEVGIAQKRLGNQQAVAGNGRGVHDCLN